MYRPTVLGVLGTPTAKMGWITFGGICTDAEDLRRLFLL
jgi:hypothetical protein